MSFEVDESMPFVRGSVKDRYLDGFNIASYLPHIDENIDQISIDMHSGFDLQICQPRVIFYHEEKVAKPARGVGHG